jgi:hypothetical protein
MLGYKKHDDDDDVDDATNNKTVKSQKTPNN